MANTNAESGIIEILSKLDEEDLFALARTVTQGLLQINSKDDAIKGILKYSPDELSILRRKALTREILFAYLDKKNVPVKLPVTKNDLIDKIVDYWKVPRTSNINQIPNNSQTVCEQPPKEVKQTEESNSITLLAEQFAKWFYTMINSDENISEHFFPDAIFKLNLYCNGDCDTTVVENDPEEINQSLFNVKLQHSLFFNPNVSKEGVQGRMDSHGLVIVLACGTLHVHDSCAGVFEQAFALARDPTCDNNWKIKNTELNLRSKAGISGQPSLCDSELTASLLMLPSN